MRIWYDTEFIENGRTIDLISIGMICEDGTEFYAISSEFSLSGLERSKWLMEHVAPSLPLKPVGDGGPWDREHPDFVRVMSRKVLANAVAAFIRATPDPELWAWYGAYDHVVLCQLWGRMVDLPDGIPMYTNDLKQECNRLGNPALPVQESGQHNALEDARHNRAMAEYLDQLATKERS